MAISLEDRVRELEAKVAELSEREAIRALRLRYHECVNEAKTAEIPDLFTEDGELEFGHLGRAKGRDQIKAFFSGSSPPMRTTNTGFCSSPFVTTASAI